MEERHITQHAMWTFNGDASMLDPLAGAKLKDRVPDVIDWEALRRWLCFVCVLYMVV